MSLIKLRKNGLLSKGLYFLPSIVILVLAMVALHASLDLMEDSEKILNHYVNIDDAHPHNNNSHSHTIIDIEHLRLEHSKFYVAVLALGLMAFLLYLLAVNKMADFRRVNEENKKYMDVLQNQLAAIEAAGDGIGIVDPNGNLTFMNQALMELHGIAPEKLNQFIGHSWINLYNQKGREMISQNVLPALEKNRMWQGTSPVVRQNGDVIMVELSLRMLEDGSMIGTARDISERQKSETQRKELEQQFYQAQKMEAIGRLAGGIAHDFNNVLAAINGYAEFLTEDLDASTPQRGYAESILKAGQQARKVVDQILAFSRQKQSGKEAFDVLSPIQETISMLKASLPKTVELQQSLNAEQTMIDGNATQIAQVIMNLCVNAKDAIDDVSEEHGTITISLENTQAEDIKPEIMLNNELLGPSITPPISIEDIDAGHVRLTLGVVARKTEYVCLRVEDTGSGMSRAIMEHIFEPFFTTKAVDKGTGLGLATVHGVLSSHQGAMVVDSILGQGTVFNLYFPLSRAHELSQDQDIFDENDDYRGSGNILVVDDQDSVRAILIEMLERMGYTAHPCENGVEALTLLREEPEYFDLVVTDQNMPVMTGMELVQQTHFTLPGMPFILVSGYSQERLQDIMNEHPSIKAILRKPISGDQLAQKVRTVLSGNKKEAA
ncbi:MAG: response regulator [Alphaproteobacteria bacterium]|nr:response regulator [Alphaproteobacteria bacterium]MCD8570291.1 response regulator [Alphaproteobacteria bacterium]